MSDKIDPIVDEYIADVFRSTEKYLRSIRSVVVEASKGVAFEHKEDEGSTVVTAFDKEIEQKLRSLIHSNTTVVAGIVGEEFGSEGSEQTFWTIDPIDGTEHFVRNDPFYVCMLAFVYENKPVASLLYNFSVDELYIASPATGAQCNGENIQVSDRTLEKAIVETESRLENPTAFHLLQLMAEKIYVPQKFGACAGYGFLQVARGASEARVQVNGYGYLWDYLPGQILVLAAGGDVITPGKASWDWRDLNSIVSNHVVARDLAGIVDRWSSESESSNFSNKQHG